MKARILNEAESLFRQKSYSGFSYQDISRPLGIKNAAVHYHFPTKGDLGVAIIGRYRRLLARLTRRETQSGEEAVRQLESFFRFELGQFEEKKLVCPIGVVATDYLNLPDAVREQTQLLVEETVDWLTRVLQVGRQDGQFRFDGPARDKASLIFGAFLGVRQLTRVAGPKVVTPVIEQIRRDLKMA